MKFTNEQIEQGLDKIFDNLLQTKDVEASESMEITPDEGYAGIKKVNLTVKGGGGGAIEYLDLRGTSLGYTPLLFSTVAVCRVYGDIVKGPASVSLAQFIQDEAHTPYSILACGFDWDAQMEATGFGLPKSSVKEAFIDILTQMGSYPTKEAAEEFLASIPRLTEEEFYNLNA